MVFDNLLIGNSLNILPKNDFAYFEANYFVFRFFAIFIL